LLSRDFFYFFRGRSLSFTESSDPVIHILKSKVHLQPMPFLFVPRLDLWPGRSLREEAERDIDRLKILQCGIGDVVNKTAARRGTRRSNRLQPSSHPRRIDAGKQSCRD
jgi:hypothetical protein